MASTENPEVSSDNRLETNSINMAKDSAKTSTWLTSKDVQKQLSISSCELMHLRESGRLTASKNGNAYRYDPELVDQIRKSAAKDQMNRPSSRPSSTSDHRGET